MYNKYESFKKPTKLILFGLFFLLGLTGSAIAQAVLPDFYDDPGLNPNRDYVNQSFNEHIDPFTGALQHHYVDLHIPGNGGFDLKVVRSYNSVPADPFNPEAGMQPGVGWTIHFGRALKTQNTFICSNQNALSVADNPVLELPDGSRQLLAFTGTANPPLMLTTQRWKADCSTATSGGLVVYSPDGTRYDMTHLVNVGSAVSPVFAWYTTKITDRNGNFATISYPVSSSPQIGSVTTNDGRTISFSYSPCCATTPRITSISGAGQTYSYNYQAIAGIFDRFFLTSVTRPDGTSWSYSYNGNLNNLPGSYNMNRATYPEGGSINYTYGFAYFDAQANPSYRSSVVTSKSLSTGGNWTFSYTPGSSSAYDTTTVTSLSGTTTYRHVGPNYTTSGTVWTAGLLMSKTIGTTQTETYTWAKQKISNENYFRPGQFVLKVDVGETNAPVLAQRQIVRNGATYTTSYSVFDSYGNPGTVIESGPNGGSRTSSLTYYINTSKWIVKQVQNESFTGSSMLRSFDANGNLTSLNRDGVTTSYSYDLQGNIASATFPRTLTHSYSNYKRGIPQAESQPQAIAITRIVSDAGNVTSETNGDGRITTYGYDGLNRLTSIVNPVGNSVAISYTATSKTANRGGLIESTVYNGFGNPISITLGGVVRTYTYDALNRRTFASNPGGGVGTSYQYDILDRVTKVTNADSTSQNVTYGAGAMTVSDERGKLTTTSYRAYGNPDQQFLMSISAPETSANIALTRNAKDLVASVTQGGFTRSYGYNANFYLTSVVNPETGTTSYGRDAAGNMTSRSVGVSGATAYAYDGQNRLTSVTYPGSTPSVTNTYNKIHKLLTANSSAGNRSFGYDPNGNLTSESVTVDGITLSTGYAYNGNDQLSTITYPRSGRVVSYTPDVLGRPTLVSGYVSAVSYWPSGQVQQITHVNGAVANYGQNSRLWPSNFVTQKGTTGYISSSYSYDGVGNLTSVNDTVDVSYNRTLGYDNINRLSSITGPWGAGSIAYSGVGNIVSQTLGAFNLNYTYDAQNRLASVSGNRATSYTYDAYGDIATASGNSYTYDGAPNLSCINCADTTNKIEYAYDGLNQRVSVTKAGVKTYEVYGSHGNLLAEYTPSLANKLVEYIYLGGKRVAQRESDDVVISSTALSVTPNPAVVNQQVTLTATVTGNSPTGTVTFQNAATPIGTATVSAGVATLATSFTNVGSYSLTASYSGDANNIASTAPATILNVNAIVPGAPTGVSTVGGNAQATVSFTAPASDGGAAISSYTATSSPSGLTATCSVSPCIVTGLTNGTAYTFTVTATNAVGTSAASLASNSVTPAPIVPDAPTSVTAVGGNAQATVTFTAPASNGGAAITGYTVTSSPNGFTASCAASPCAVTGLSNGATYTFTVTATNAVGTSAASLASNSVTLAALVPDAPTGVTAVGGDAQASVTFTAPASDGGAAITGYTATSSPGGLTASCAASPCTVTGLSNGATYTFTVTATNAVATSAASLASNSVTPAASVAVEGDVPTLPEWGMLLLGMILLGLALPRRATRRAD